MVVITSLTAPAHASEDATKLTLLGQLDLSPGVIARNSDVWGWVNPANGKEYAVVGEWGGRSAYIVDVSDPKNPVLASTLFPTPGFDVKTWGTYLYAVDGDALSIDGKIWDIANPNQPHHVANMASGHNITIVDGYLYKSVGGSTIYDLANPTVPVLKWFDGDFNGGHDHTVVGNRLYDFHGPGGTFIYDVTNKTAPQLLGSLAHPNDFGITYHHNGYPTTDGNYLFITDELGLANAPDITVWDISSPSNMTRVGGYTDPNATVHNVFVVGDLLFASFYVAGVRVFDISQPWNPVLLDTYDTAPNIAGNGVYDGCWGVYPFAPSGVIYVSDMRTGLYLFSFPGLAVPVTITAFNAHYGDDAVNLNWAIGESNGLSGFRIYRSVGDGDSFVSIASIPAGTTFQHVDRDVRPGSTYWYRLGAVDADGEFMSQIQKIVIPEPSFALGQNYPNPFNPTTSIDYIVPADGFVSLIVYNAGGQQIRTLVSEVQTAGTKTVGWNGTGDDGARVASGVYFYRLNAGASTETRRMILLK